MLVIKVTLGWVVGVMYGSMLALYDGGEPFNLDSKLHLSIKNGSIKR